MWIAGTILIILALIAVTTWWYARRRAGERAPEREAADLGEPPGTADPTWDPRSRYQRDARPNARSDRDPR